MDLPTLYNDHPQQELIINECIIAASRTYKLDPLVLRAIREQERGDRGTFTKNSNDSYDYGPFQINSIHLSDLRKYGITVNHLTYDICANARVAAWHLRNKINEIGGDVWRGVGRYHSKTEKHAAPYRNSVFSKYRKLIKRKR